jgi:hypothetical protein
LVVVLSNWQVETRLVALLVDALSEEGRTATYKASKNASFRSGGALASLAATLLWELDRSGKVGWIFL